MIYIYLRVKQCLQKNFCFQRQIIYANFEANLILIQKLSEDFSSKLTIECEKERLK